MVGLAGVGVEVFVSERGVEDEGGLGVEDDCQG